jgi:hypothetical protein
MYSMAIRIRPVAGKAVLLGGLTQRSPFPGHCALAGYAARTLLAASAALTPGRVDELAGLCPGHPEPGTLPARWFHTRYALAVAALRDELPAGTALHAFALSSVLRLRNTPAGQRQTHIDAALAALTGEGFP